MIEHLLLPNADIISQLYCNQSEKESSLCLSIHNLSNHAFHVKKMSEERAVMLLSLSENMKTQSA